MFDNGFAFILSSIKVDAALPFELAPKHWIDRATEQQIETIKSHLAVFRAGPLSKGFSPYENDIQRVPGDKPGNFSYQPTALPPAEWRYFVVKFEGTNIDLAFIQQACLVIPNEIRLGFQVFDGKHGAGLAWHSQSLFTFFIDHGFGMDVALPVSAEDLMLVSETYAALREIPTEREQTSRAFHRFQELCNISEQSELTVIGLFSVIESLLTHAPKLSESADSLTHQIRTKMPLIRKRFVRALDHQSLFGEIQEEKLWTRLYAYRSAIVHGVHATFDGELQVLRDRTTVISFLREAAKLLLIASIREPVLMADLRKC